MHSGLDHTYGEPDLYNLLLFYKSINQVIFLLERV